MLKHQHIKEFSKSLQKLLRANYYFQKDLAEAINLDPKVFSRKLNNTGGSHLSTEEVWRIIGKLAQWKVITTRNEALHLLELAGVDLDGISNQQWQALPFSLLTNNDVAYQKRVDNPLSRSSMHNLPTPLTRLVGREEAIERLHRLLIEDEVRLVTLVGTGGSGKTRLALHVAHDLVERFAHGVWLVALAAVDDVAQVPLRIMQTLDIKPTPSMLAVESLITYLHDKQLLLLLDNFEQLGAAAPFVSELLEAVPGLKVLVTSRGVLHLYGEHAFNVPPLEVPVLSMKPGIVKLEQFSAVQLFVERARAAEHNFALTNENATSIAQICARVDGLPLALELAAARVKMLPPVRLLERLSTARLSVLVGGARNLPDRQQTLRNTITWSYDLLSSSEQTWFARLGVFFGGWSLEAAESMMQAIPERQQQDERPIAEPPLDVLQRLVDNSLLVRLPPMAGQVRFTLLETLREYALERLNAHGEFERLRDWHSCYYLSVVEAAEAGLKGAEQLIWQARLVTEQDNIRAALEWSVQRARSGASMQSLPVPALEVALRMAAALRTYWEWQGHLVEGRDWFDAILEMPLDNTARAMLAARARALGEAARLVCLQNEQSKAIALAEESIALWQQLNEPEGLATALLYRGWSALVFGDYDLAKEMYKQGLQLLTSTDSVWLRAQLLFYLAAAMGFSFEFEQMQSYYEQSKRLFEQIGDRSAVADLLKDRGGMAILEGDSARAITNLVKSIQLSHELGYKQYIATGMGLLGFAVGLRGEPDPITASLKAAQLWGAKEHLMSSIGSSSWLDSYPIAQMMKREIRERVDEASWQKAWQSGRELSIEQAVAVCLALNGEAAKRDEGVMNEAQ